MSVTLGIHDGHNATAALVSGGEVRAAVQEGRITRKKNEAGYPRRAIDEVMEIAGAEVADIDRVALSSQFMHAAEFFEGWDWYRKNYRDQIRSAAEEPERRRYYLERRQRERRATIVEHLGVNDEQIRIVEHHTGHAAAAYYASPWAGGAEQVLVLTLDGSGDGICATVSVGHDGELERISETESSASMGKVYSRVTFLLGMRPWQDEFKVMGMAPYADEDLKSRVRPVLDPLVQLSEGALAFEPGTHLSTNVCYSYLRSNLENQRFDFICGAVQDWLEDLVTRWVRNAVRETGIPRVAVGGGVFMNVKANMRLAALDEVDEVFVHPSCGDTSLAIGAAYAVCADEDGSAGPEGSLGPIYWGPGYGRDEMGSALSERSMEVEEPQNVEARVAELLAQGHIVANFDGRMEWGARALGNRSILVDPRDRDSVRRVNMKVKERDFWMPFAPTILSERASDYIEGFAGQRAPYMIRAFPTTDQGKRDLPAAMHPYDETIRPQILTQEDNPGYWRILKEFEERTGVGGVLNTSFNLHGEPIVRSPEDAVDTLARSGLHWLRLGPYVVRDE